jgi:hypothetical protein
MTAAADNDGLQDWAADYEGKGGERAARDVRDSGVVMMAAAKMAVVEDSSGGSQLQWRRMTAADDDGTHDRAADYDGEG